MVTPRSIIPLLPSILTLGNLLCGFLAIAKTVDALQISGGGDALDPAFSAKILSAAYLVLLAMVFDALDGRVARLTKQTSAFGAQLDSLADVVTFGVAPAVMAKVAYEHGMVGLGYAYSAKLVTLLCGFYLVGAVLRLARFTSGGAEESDESHQTFEGLPSPAAAGVILSLTLFIFDGRRQLPLEADSATSLAVWLLHGLPGIACALGLLMVSRVPYVHVVQRYIGHNTRLPTFVIIALVCLFMILFHEWSLMVVACSYALGSTVLAVRARIRGQTVLDALPEPWQPERSENASADPDREERSRLS
ncbi:MAG: CDP-diacylglycerol--serine O-phosphatidyltransferase [Planctomycetota bacterium]|nr:MAG: CDP-diacylglycerol--serine O-phosphatidyltransferase [Planctomycetota bacterium]